MRVLIVEDEPAITDFVSRGLHGDGARGQRRPRRRRGGAACPAGGIDLVILDLMLPRRDGLDVLGIIRRERPTLPVIVLSARDGVPDRVAGLDAGATDYMVKPFSFAELAARVRAHLRGPEQPRGSRLSGSGIELDLLSREVNRDGEAVRLSAKEFQLLAHFLRHRGLTLSRAQILSAVWGYDFEPQTNIVDVYVGYLRRKLAVTGRPAPIQTVRSVGYRLAGG